MKYVDAEKLIAEIERRRLSNRYIDTEDYENELLEIIDSLQQEQPNDLASLISEATTVAKRIVDRDSFYNSLPQNLRNKYTFNAWCEILEALSMMKKQEQSEPVKGKFVFPKFLYARTLDNKTIDVSYVPQSMDAIEYIRSDFLQQEQQDVDLEKAAEYYYHKGVYEGLSQGRADALKMLEEFMKRKANPVIVIKQQEHPEPSCKTCGFYENNCPFIRDTFKIYPNKVCKDYTYSVMKEHERSEVDLEKEIDAC